jgi:hypothetical protein
MRKAMGGTRRAAIATGIFAAGFLCGTLAQRPAEAQLGDVGGKVMEKAGQQGGAVGAAGQMGTTITDMQKHVEGLQKNLETFKNIQSLLGG